MPRPRKCRKVCFLPKVSEFMPSGGASDETCVVMTVDDLTTIAEKDVAFHDIIFRSTKNARLIQILNNLREQMYRYRLEYLKDTQSHDRLVEEHQRIVDAIIDKNKEEAVRLIQEHIYIQELTVIKKLQEQEA